MPKGFFSKHGSFDKVHTDQTNAIETFIRSYWPQLSKRHLNIQVAYDEYQNTYNTFLIGKNSPLSKCCKMVLNFQFTKDIGGRVICLEGLCTNNPLEYFYFDIDLFQKLFNTGKQTSDLMGVRESRMFMQPNL